MEDPIERGVICNLFYYGTLPLVPNGEIDGNEVLALMST